MTAKGDGNETETGGFRNIRAVNRYSESVQRGNCLVQKGREGEREESHADLGV